MQLLNRLKDQVEVLLCIYAGDIERKKLRADFGVTYDLDAMRLIDELREWEVMVRAVVVTRFDGQPAAQQFMNRLERRGMRVYVHAATEGYPTDVDTIVSERGYGANEYIETERPIVVVTAPGPGSGKLATCLSQLYHDHLRGIRSGYAKFETFPIWNLPLKHPVNIAYEAATADLGDFNQVDPFHLETYGQTAINYNRDVEVFPVLKRILEKITGERSLYASPTDMGVNRAGFAISDDSVVQAAAVQEIIRRYFRAGCEYAMGIAEAETVQRVELLMKEVGVEPRDRPVVVPARRAAEEGEQQERGSEGVYVGAALALPDGTIVTGKNSPLMHAASALILNAIKQLAGLPDSLPLLPENVIASIERLKSDALNSERLSLDLDETLIALSISATTNPAAEVAMDKLGELRGCDMHLTHMPTPGDEAGLRQLGINLTSDPGFASKSLLIS